MEHNNSHLEKKKNQINLVIMIPITLFLVVYVYPIIWMYISSVRSMADFLNSPLGIPDHWYFSNYKEAYELADLGRHFLISIFITCTSTLAVVLLSSLAAFSFSRLKYYGRNFFYSLFFLGLILPVQSYLVGMFVEFRVFGILDTYMAEILPMIAMNLPIAMLLMKNFFDSLPVSLEESAIIEGASIFQIYRMIIMPISQAITVTVVTITAINVWNAFLIPFVMIHTNSIKPLTTSLYVFSTMHASQITLKLAALAMITTPMLIVYFVFQRQIQRGITAGAIKS